MPGCILRVQGSTTKVQKFLRATELEPTKAYWKGEVGFPSSRGPSKFSGFNLSLSGSHGESLQKQARQALTFLQKNNEAILLLKSLGFTSVIIDFGLYDLATENKPWPTYHLPAKLVVLLGKFNFELCLSFYGKP